MAVVAAAFALQHTVVVGCMPNTQPIAQGQASRRIVALKSQVVRMQSANTGRAAEVSRGRQRVR